MTRLRCTDAKRQDVVIPPASGRDMSPHLIPYNESHMREKGNQCLVTLAILSDTKLGGFTYFYLSSNL